MRTRISIAIALAGCGGGPASSHDTPSPSPVVAASSTPSSAAPKKVAIGPDAEKADVSSITGKQMPDWNLPTWFNSAPLHPADLRGRVVLVRWFMSAECPYCSATAPSLVELDRDYQSRGLTVVGMYHHKSEGPLVVEDVRTLVRDHYKFRFPIAIDEDWKTLKQWWLTDHPESWTSVSFLVDKKGVVRFVHLGGEYAPGSNDYKQMRSWIDELLAEPAPAPG